MAYPTSLDNLKDDYDGADQADVVDHAGMHNDERAAINAIQAELGTTPSGAAATVAVRLDAIDADPRWTNARTPTAHKTSHATGGADAISTADIGAATTAQGSKADTAVQPARTVAAGTGLSGGGDLSADRTISVAAGGIGTTQLADNAVTAAKIAADAVGSSELADNAVDTAAIADNAVTSTKIADGAIVNADINAAAAIAPTKIAGTALVATTADAKGDLLAGTAADTVARLAVGIDGMALVADSAAASGLAWKAGAYAAKTVSYTLTSADSVVAVDTTSGAVTLTLPAASGVTGKPLRIIKTAGSGTLAVQRAGTDTITPSSGRTQVAFPADALMGEMTLVSTGTAWHLISGQASTEAGGRRLWRVSQALMATNTTPGLCWVQVADAATIGNLLTLNQASGGDALGSTTGLGVVAGAATTIARSTAQAASGTGSILVTSASTLTDTASMAVTPRPGQGTPVEVLPNVTYTATFKALTSVGTRSVKARLLWWNGGAFVSANDATIANPTVWTRAMVTGTAPATATHVSVETAFATAGSINDAYFADEIGFWLGAGGTWVLPGVPIANTGFRANPADATQVQVWNPGNSTWITV